MYSSVHAASGVCLYLGLSSIGTPLAVSMCLAGLSHHYMDYLGESECYGGFYKGVLYDTVFLQGSILLSAYFLIGWEGALCGFLANGMDFIDKFMSKVLKKKEMFPCHKPGFNIIKYFTPQETRDLNLISTVLIIILMIMYYIGN